MIKVRKRTQAERSGSTRTALLEAAIDSLCKHGYSATTTLAVCEASQVSRGSLLHQFPTRADLMVHVVEAVFAEELDRYAERLRDITDARERVLALPKIVWEILSRPSGVATLEVLQGSRSDPVLAGKLAPVQARIEEHALAFIGAQAGTRARDGLALMRLVVWSARGLSIAKVLAPEGDRVGDSIGLLRKLLEAGFETGLLALDPDDRDAAPARAGRARRSA